MALENPLPAPLTTSGYTRLKSLLSLWKHRLRQRETTKAAVGIGQVPTGRPAVLFISPQPFFVARGSPIRVRFEAQALAELGFQVDLLVLPFGQDLEIPGVRLVRIANLCGLPGVSIGPSFWKVVYDIILFCKAWRLASRTSYVAIHCVEDAGISGLFLRQRTGCKLIFDKHSDIAAYRGGRIRNLMMWLYQKIDTQVIRRADAVVTGQPLLALTRSLANHPSVYPVCDVPSTRREADPERTLAIRRRLQRRAGEVVIMYLGNFAIYQGVELMFQAILSVVRHRPDARFVVIGGLAEDVVRWRRWLAQRKAGDAVLFVPGVEPDDVPDYLAAADILLSPRRTGCGAPLKHLDYLNANRAIVAPDTPANRFYLDKTVALLTGITAQQFADGIIQLIANPVLRQQLARNGRARVEGCYDYRQLREGLRACYDALGLGRDCGRETPVGQDAQRSPNLPLDHPDAARVISR